MISAVAWIPSGAAQAIPTLADLSPEELKALQAQGEPPEEPQADSESDDGSESMDDEDDPAAAVTRAKAAAKALTTTNDGKVAGMPTLEEAMRQLDMEHYDESDDEDAGTLGRVLGGNTSAMYNDETDDPYITLPGAEDSDEEDLQIKPDDLLILAAKNEDDVSHLEVWLYEPATEEDPANLYVHHDVMLPAFPLAVEWLDLHPGRGTQGNLAAVGAMEPGIELWDLDVLDAVEPVACLGGQIKAAANGMDVDAAPETTTPPARKKKKKKKKASPALVHGSHTDAVLGLAWNREFRNVLASASADTTVKVWDIVTQQCQHTLDHHRDKVQALQWHPTQHATLLSGGFDRQAAVVDARSPDGAPMTVPVSADVEAVAWATDSQFLVSSEDGMVALFDTRVGGKKGQTAVWRLQAHDKAACAVGVCPAALHVMVTASVDKKVKLWDTSSGAPSLLAAKDLGVGAVFAARFCPEAPQLLVAGGSKGTAAVWDVGTSAEVAAAMGGRLEE